MVDNGRLRRCYPVGELVNLQRYYICGPKVGEKAEFSRAGFKIWSFAGIATEKIRVLKPGKALRMFCVGIGVKKIGDRFCYNHYPQYNRNLPWFLVLPLSSLLTNLQSRKSGGWGRDPSDDASGGEAGWGDLKTVCCGYPRLLADAKTG